MLIKINRSTKRGNQIEIAVLIILHTLHDDERSILILCPLQNTEY